MRCVVYVNGTLLCQPERMRRRSRNARYRIPLSVHQFVRLLNTTSTEREDLLSELYFNRTVAVVGPAGYLEQQQQLQHSKMEQTIQNADTVVRPNVKFDPNTRSLFLPPHTTSRTTIVYHSGLAPDEQQRGPGGMLLATDIGSSLSDLALRVYAEHGIKAVVMTELRFQRLQSLRRLRAPEGIHLITPRRFPANVLRFHTGMKALIDVLRHAPRRLYLFGYDFYQTPLRAFRGYYSELERAGVPRHQMGDAAFHSTAEELTYIRQNIMRSGEAHAGVVTIDDHLRSLLSLSQHDAPKNDQTPRHRDNLTGIA